MGSAIDMKVCAALTALVCVAAAAVAPGCTSFNVNAVTEVSGPDYGQFKQFAEVDGGLQVGVSTVLERRCGTLDCHGQVGRPLRIYGQYGLRFQDDAGDTPGLQPTSENEHEANYQSVIGLQPELMTEVAQGNAPPLALMLLRKPLQIERHKGGPVLNAGDYGVICISTWLQGQTNFAACTNAAAQ
jgi:hypothetical protein